MKILEDQKLLAMWPVGWVPGREMIATEETRYADLVREIEIAQGWIYDPDTRRFRVASATHTVDGPDSFGAVAAGARRVSPDARSMVSIQVRYRRIEASGTSEGQSVASGLTLGVVSASLPEGVPGQWSSVEEREFFEGVQSADGSSGAVVRTARGVVSAGTEITGLAARLPGGLCRLDGSLSISAFTGESRNRATVLFPLAFDGRRGQWHRVYAASSLDVTATAALRGVGIKLGASGAVFVIEVRVD